MGEEHERVGKCLQELKCRVSRGRYIYIAAASAQWRCDLDKQISLGTVAFPVMINYGPRKCHMSADWKELGRSVDECKAIRQSSPAVRVSVQ